MVTQGSSGKFECSQRERTYALPTTRSDVRQVNYSRELYFFVGDLGKKSEYCKLSRSRAYDPSPDFSFRCSIVDLEETCRGRVIKLNQITVVPLEAIHISLNAGLFWKYKSWCAEKSGLVFHKILRLNLFLIQVLFFCFRISTCWGWNSWNKWKTNSGNDR